MKNASVSYSRLQNCCSNRLVVHMSAICVVTVITVVQLMTLNFLSVFFLFPYAFNIISVIVLYVYLSVLFYGPRCLKLKLMMMMMMMMTGGLLRHPLRFSLSPRNLPTLKCSDLWHSEARSGQE